jgi:hypothetical protein
MTDIVAIVSVLSTAAVALGSATITAISTSKQQRTRFRSETRRDREDELRQVAEDAAIKLSYAIDQLDRARDKSNDRIMDLGPLHEAYGEIRNSENRLAIRLGDEAPEVACYRAAVDHVARAQDLAAATDRRMTADATIQRKFNDYRQSAFASERKFRELISKRLSPDVI